MKIATAAAGLLTLAALLAAPAHAQDLQHGLWSGAMTPPGGEPVPVMVQVTENAEGALALVMSNPDLGPMVLSDPAVDGDELTFWWNPGVRVDCTLTRQEDGSYQGPCADDRGASGGEGEMVMRPPQA